MKSKSLLSKVAALGKRSVGGNGHGRLPGNVLAYLEREFHLLPKDMLTLRCIGRRGSIAGSPTMFIRIFDYTASERDIAVKDYRDLDKHPKLVLFEGHVFGGGVVYLKKNRAGSA